MFDLVKSWYEESCGLRLVESVKTVADDPNEGFTELIPQFADEDDPVAEERN